GAARFGWPRGEIWKSLATWCAPRPKRGPPAAAHLPPAPARASIHFYSILPGPGTRGGRERLATASQSWATSQSSRQVDELGRHAEAFGEMRPEGAHPPRLRCVVAAVVHVDAALDRVEVRVVSSLARHQRVQPRRDRIGDH